MHKKIYLLSLLLLVFFTQIALAEKETSCQADIKQMQDIIHRQGGIKSTDGEAIIRVRPYNENRITLQTCKGWGYITEGWFCNMRWTENNWMNTLICI